MPRAENASQQPRPISRSARRSHSRQADTPLNYYQRHASRTAHFPTCFDPCLPWRLFCGRLACVDAPHRLWRPGPRGPELGDAGFHSHSPSRSGCYKASQPPDKSAVDPSGCRTREACGFAATARHCGRDWRSDHSTGSFGCDSLRHSRGSSPRPATAHCLRLVESPRCFSRHDSGA